MATSEARPRTQSRLFDERELSVVVGTAVEVISMVAEKLRAEITKGARFGINPMAIIGKIAEVIEPVT